MVNEQPWVRRELAFTGPLQRGSRGARVKAVQEWLCLGGSATGIDSDYASATERAVEKFQRDKGLPLTGNVDQRTWDALVKPLIDVLTPIPATGRDLPALVVAYAERHLAAHPREVGGQNCGPWVRVYMEGNEGEPWAWCSGFVCFVVQQAAETLGQRMPFARTGSCDSLAAAAKELGILVAEKDVKRTPMPAGSIFLVRRTPTDWIHTGIVTRFGVETFDTIEGNTNDEGSREGYEVCARFRSYAQRDFVNLAKWQAEAAAAVAAPTTRAASRSAANAGKVAPATARITLTVTAPAGVTVKAQLVNKTDKSPPQDVPLNRGIGNVTVVANTPYILRIDMVGPPGGYNYAVNLTTPTPGNVVSRDGEYPSGPIKSKASRATFIDNFEVVR